MVQESTNLDKTPASKTMDPSPSDQMLRALIAELKFNLQQVKRMHAAIPKQDLFKRIRNGLLLLLFGMISGIAFIIHSPKLLPMPGGLTIAGGAALATQDQIAIFAWGKESKAFVDCITIPDNDKKEKLCSIRIHYNNS